MANFAYGDLLDVLNKGGANVPPKPKPVEVEKKVEEPHLNPHVTRAQAEITRLKKLNADLSGENRVLFAKLQAANEKVNQSKIGDSSNEAMRQLEEKRLLNHIQVANDKHQDAVSELNRSRTTNNQLTTDLAQTKAKVVILTNQLNEEKKNGATAREPLERRVSELTKQAQEDRERLEKQINTRLALEKEMSTLALSLSSDRARLEKKVAIMTKINGDLRNRDETVSVPTSPVGEQALRLRVKNLEADLLASRKDVETLKKENPSAEPSYYKPKTPRTPTTGNPLSPSNAAFKSLKQILNRSPTHSPNRSRTGLLSVAVPDEESVSINIEDENIASLLQKIALLEAALEQKSAEFSAMQAKNVSMKGQLDHMQAKLSMEQETSRYALTQARCNQCGGSAPIQHPPSPTKMFKILAAKPGPQPKGPLSPTSARTPTNYSSPKRLVGLARAQPDTTSPTSPTSEESETNNLSPSQSLLSPNRPKALFTTSPRRNGPLLSSPPPDRSKRIVLTGNGNKSVTTPVRNVLTSPLAQAKQALQTVLAEQKAEEERLAARQASLDRHNVRPLEDDEPSTTTQADVYSEETYSPRPGLGDASSVAVTPSPKKKTKSKIPVLTPREGSARKRAQEAMGLFTVSKEDSPPRSPPKHVENIERLHPGRVKAEAAVLLKKTTPMLGIQIPSSRSGATGVATDELEREAVISMIVPDGPADLAGLRPGLVVCSINKQDIKTHADFVRACKSRRPGERLKLQVLNGEEYEQCELTVHARELSLNDLKHLLRMADGHTAPHDHILITDIQSRLKYHKLHAQEMANDANAKSPRKTGFDSQRYMVHTSSSSNRRKGMMGSKRDKVTTIRPTTNFRV